MEETTSPGRDADHAQVAGAPSDNTTISGILAAFRAEGHEADLTAVGDRGELRCSACDTTSSATDFEVLAERRLEGASDPDDMVLAIAARCPSCATSGVAVLAYGPVAGEADAAVIALLP